MNEIKCPHCGKVFQVDESGYAQILQQVRDDEFKRAVDERVKLVDEKHRDEIKLALAHEREAIQQDAFDKDKRIAELEAQLSSVMEQSKRDIQSLKEKAEAEQDVLKAKVQQEASDKINELNSKILLLENEKATIQRDQEFAIVKAVSVVEKERDALTSQLNIVKAQAESSQNELRAKLAMQEQQSQEQLRAKDDEIARVRDFKKRLSTKMVGESLEQHCESEFNKIRAMAFPRATFGKDNEVVDGSKGDYVFRELDEDGTEIISIMFEMKNEADETKTKHKNADFFKKLDSDRNKKGCEYAVLVSMLEADSDLYDQGIVDVSYEYEKMYVIRPQFFIPLIGLLRNAALKNLEAKRELAIMRQQNIDVTHFEEELEAFKAAFGRNYDLASRKFQKAIDDIDKTIKTLQTIKDNLLGSENNLRLANKKAEDLTVKRLTRKNPTMKAKFDALKSGDEE